MLNRIIRKLRSIGKRSANAASDSPLRKYVDASLLLPADALLRLGTVYGGWLIPADPGLTETSVCYLAGAGEDISFDCALAQRFHCAIRIVDPTPRAVQHFEQLKQAVEAGRRFPVNKSATDFYSITPADFSRLTFLPVGLADQDTELKFYMPRDPAHVSCSTVNLQKTDSYFTAQCHQLITVMAQQGDKKVDLVKMDIEGAEYSVIRDMVSTGVLPGILLVEFDEAHTPADANADMRIQSHIAQLVEAGMRCIAVEGSNATFVKTVDHSCGA